jgi:hypothetical protein
MAAFGPLVGEEELRIVAAPSVPIPAFDCQPQEHSNWCWAAVAVGMARALKSIRVLQCEVVSRHKGANCCPPASPVNEVASLSEILQKQFGIDCDWENARFLKDTWQAYETIRRRLDAHLPVPILVQWKDEATGTWPGHYVCAIGYEMLESEPALWIFDPWRDFAADGNRRLQTLTSMSSYRVGGAARFGRWTELYLPKSP